MTIGTKSKCTFAQYKNNNDNDYFVIVSHCCCGNKKCVTWDVRVSDTMAQSHVNKTSKTIGAAAEVTAKRKTNNCSSLTQLYLFVPVAAKTMGTINKD